jgi:transcriptional regulator with XRE-family HTH domain
MKLSDQIRRAVDDSGLSRRAICKASGLHKSAMSRFMAGKRGLSLMALDRLAAVLALDLTAHGKPKALPRKGPGRKPKARKGGAS